MPKDITDPRKRAMAAALLQGGPGLDWGIGTPPAMNSMVNGFTGPQLQEQMGMLNENWRQGQYGQTDDDVIADFFQAVETGAIPRTAAAGLIKQWMAFGGLDADEPQEPRGPTNFRY